MSALAPARPSIEALSGLTLAPSTGRPWVTLPTIRVAPAAGLAIDFTRVEEQTQTWESDDGIGIYGSSYGGSTRQVEVRYRRHPGFRVGTTGLWVSDRLRGARTQLHAVYLATYPLVNPRTHAPRAFYAQALHDAWTSLGGEPVGGGGWITLLPDPHYLVDPGPTERLTR